MPQNDNPTSANKVMSIHEFAELYNVSPQLVEKLMSGDPAAVAVEKIDAAKRDELRREFKNQFKSE